MGKSAIKQNFFTSLNNYFFSETQFHTLGLLRIVLSTLCIYHSLLSYRLMHGITNIGNEYTSLHEPTILMRFFPLPFPLPQEYGVVFAIIYYLIGLCAIAGIFTRPALVLFSMLTIYMVSITASRGFFNHEASLTTQVLLALAFIPGSTSFSVDRLIKWYYQRRNAAGTSLFTALVGPPVPVWGTKLILILLAFTYFTAGVSKLRYSDGKWMDGQTLTHYLDGSASPYTEGIKPMYIGPDNVSAEEKWKDGFGIYSYSYGNRQRDTFKREVGNRIAANPAMIKTVSIATVIFELCGFLVLFGGWIRILYLIGAIGMHKSIGFLMNLGFIDYQAICFLMIDWEWVYKHINSRIKQKVEPVFVNIKGFLSKV